MTDGQQIDAHAGVAEGGRQTKRDLKERAVHEIRTLVVMFVYLWVLLGVFVLHESIVLAQHHISFTMLGVAGINAIILAKIMLIADDLHLARGLKDKPLIYPILYQSAAFAAVFICFHVLEKIVGGLLGGETLSQSIPIIGGGSIKGILSVSVIVMVALIPFFAFKELARVIGARELHALLFTRGAEAGALQSTPRP
jgi:hypothetical protein